MKKCSFLLRVLMAILTGYLLITPVACKKKDPCKGTTCMNGGVCIDGKCKCPAGYYGDGCEKAIPDTSHPVAREGFEGSWNGSQCGYPGFTTNMTIIATDTPGRVSLKYPGYHPVYATYSGSTLSIDTQALNRLDGGLMGSGLITGKMTNILDTINFDYFYEVYQYSPMARGKFGCTGYYQRQ